MAGFADKGMIRMIIRQRRGKQISALLLMTVILCCGCSNHSSWQKAKDRYVVGVVTKSNTSEYWMSVNSGMEAAAAKYDMDVITLAPDSELDREVQEKQVEKLIDQNVDALAVAPIDSYHVRDYLDEIEKKKITAVCFDNGMVGGELPYIGIDNHKTGYQLAQELAEQLDHKGQVGIVAGDLKQKGHRERVEGFEEYMKSEPEMTVKFVESGYANLQMSEQKVRDLMGQYPQIRGIMATSAVTAMGLVDELKDTDIKIVAVDEQEDSLKAVENGQILALAAQSGYEIGYETIHYIQNLRNGKHLKKKYYLNAEILTQDNVKEYRKKDESQKYKK